MMTEYDTGLCWTCDSCGLETEEFPAKALAAASRPLPNSAVAAG